MNNSFVKNLFVWFIIFASLMGAYQIISEGKKQYSDLKYSEFLNVVESGQELQLEIKGNEITGELLVPSGDGKPEYCIRSRKWTNWLFSELGTNDFLNINNGLLFQTNTSRRQGSNELR